MAKTNFVKLSKTRTDGYEFKNVRGARTYVPRERKFGGKASPYKNYNLMDGEAHEI